VEQIQYSTVDTHISEIGAGDTVLHDGKLKTVTKYSLKISAFHGYTLFGDSYNLGNKLVKKAIIHHAMPKGK